MKFILLLTPMHFLLWGGYFTVIELSRHDRQFFEILLFVLFLYLSYLLSDYLCNKKTTALQSTILSATLFLIGKWTLLLLGAGV